MTIIMLMMIHFFFFFSGVSKSLGFQRALGSPSGVIAGGHADKLREVFFLKIDG